MSADLRTFLQDAAHSAWQPLNLDAMVQEARTRTRRRYIAQALAGVAIVLMGVLASLDASQLLGVQKVKTADEPKPEQTVAAPSEEQQGESGSGPAAPSSSRGGRRQSSGTSTEAGKAVTSPAIASLGLTGRIAFTAMDEPVTRTECPDSPCFAPSPSEIRLIDVGNRRAVQVTSSPLFEQGSGWSPDGSRIAYSLARGDATASLHTIRPDGSDNRQIVSIEGESARHPTWSPDGRQIAFVREPRSGNFGISEQQIWLVNADGTNLRRVNEISGTNYPSNPAWSPDGRYLAFARILSERSVYLLDLETKQVAFLTAGTQPAWAPDGKRLAVRAGELVKVVTVTDGGQISVVGRAGRNFSQPSWSPDGAWVAFASTSSDSVRRTIWVARPDGGQLTPVVEGPQDYWAPSWGKE